MVWETLCENVSLDDACKAIAEDLIELNEKDKTENNLEDRLVAAIKKESE